MNDEPASPILNVVVSEFTNTTPIPHDTVKGWMESQDIETMGALMNLLADPRHFSRIDPPLTFEEYFPFAARYYERTIRENPGGEWSDSRTTAGSDFAKWFIQLWENRSTYDSEIRQIKTLLKRLYEEGSQESRSNLVTSVLEHLFLFPDIADYFADWQGEPLLKSPYAEAILLANFQRQRRERDAR
jgi:hypothetical protein